MLIMSSSHSTLISLIDLSQQLPFEIDDNVKKDICFSETLVLSCGHYEGSVGSGSSSLFTCSSSKSSITPEEIENEIYEAPRYEVKDFEQAEEEAEEEANDNFFFFFFPDCNKEQTKQTKKDSKASLITTDGNILPKINLDGRSMAERCTCKGNKKKPCECFVKLPCLCGAKKKRECTCATVDTVCICDERAPPTLVCVCKKDKVCVCHPSGGPRPICTCEEVQKPCVCLKGKYASPICVCKHKPIYKQQLDKVLEVAEVAGETEVNEAGAEMYEGSEKLSNFESIEEMSESSKNQSQDEQTSNIATEGKSKTSQTEIESTFGSKSGSEVGSKQKSHTKSQITDNSKSQAVEKAKSKTVTSVSSIGEEFVEEELLEPCVCQEPEPKPKCSCFKENGTCTCGDVCICDMRHVCICEPDDMTKPCKDEDNKSICDCVVPIDCTCNQEHPGICECFEKKLCTCGNPDDCKCYKICDCKGPCLCDTKPKKLDPCLCLDTQLKTSLMCSCDEQKKEVLKLKKKRVGKDSHRWVPDVDPHHTFFDYGYNRHHLIEKKPSPYQPFQVQGVKDCPKKEEAECPVHGIKAPNFVKKIRKRSLDCCSDVGGITITVESLGEEKDRFLVQVVSNSSQEGAKTGTTLVSILDCNFHTLEENRIEHIAKKHFLKERRSYMSIGETGYYNKITKICGEKNVVKRLYHSFDDAKNFILEGANILLMRYFALSRHRGNIKTDTVLMSGEICESIYVCLGVNQSIINNKPMFVSKVERHIIQPNGHLYQTLTVMTLRGYIVSHEWADSAYIMHLNPLLEVMPEKDMIEPHQPLRERWREDLQLMSDYLDRKSTRTKDGARYLEENGALSGTIREYLQALLLLKPQDALHFTRLYFGSTLSGLDLPHDNYFDSANKHVRYYFFED